jgi:hypothetical protein
LRCLKRSSVISTWPWAGCFSSHRMSWMRQPGGQLRARGTTTMSQQTLPQPGLRAAPRRFNDRVQAHPRAEVRRPLFVLLPPRAPGHQGAQGAVLQRVRHTAADELRRPAVPRVPARPARRRSPRRGATQMDPGRALDWHRIPVASLIRGQHRVGGRLAAWTAAPA